MSGCRPRPPGRLDARERSADLGLTVQPPGDLGVHVFGVQPFGQILLDAGIGAPSHAAQALELGYDAVLLN